MVFMTAMKTGTNDIKVPMGLQRQFAVAMSCQNMSGVEHAHEGGEEDVLLSCFDGV